MPGSLSEQKALAKAGLDISPTVSRVQSMSSSTQGAWIGTSLNLGRDEDTPGRWGDFGHLKKSDFS